LTAIVNRVFFDHFLYKIQSILNNILFTVYTIRRETMWSWSLVWFTDWTKNIWHESLHQKSLVTGQASVNRYTCMLWQVHLIKACKVCGLIY